MKEFIFKSKKNNVVSIPNFKINKKYNRNNLSEDCQIYHDIYFRIPRIAKLSLGEKIQCLFSKYARTERQADIEVMTIEKFEIEPNEAILLIEEFYEKNENFPIKEMFDRIQYIINAYFED